MLSIICYLGKHNIYIYILAPGNISIQQLWKAVKCGIAIEKGRKVKQLSYEKKIMHITKL